MLNLDDNDDIDLIDIDKDLVILSLDQNGLSDIKKIDDWSSREITERICNGMGCVKEVRDSFKIIRRQNIQHYILFTW